MATPTIQGDGCRLGGVQADTAAVVCRTDDQGVNLYLQLFSDAEFQNLLCESPSAGLDANNNYQATAYLSGLIPGQKYYWRVKVDDGLGNIAYGSVNAHNAGSFRTISNNPTPHKIGINSGWCYANWRNSPGRLAAIFQNMCAAKLTHFMHVGDFYYPDLYATNMTNGYYHPESWCKVYPESMTYATVAGFRTDFMNTMRLLTTFSNNDNWVAKFLSSLIFYPMWDDHDRAYNDISDIANLTGDNALRAERAKQAGHECFMGLNKPLIDKEDGRTWTHNVSDDCYFYIDVPPVRYIMLDVRDFRDLKTATDTSTKTMLGATQKTWFENRVKDNEQKFLVVISGVMFDGFHGWNENEDDGWSGYSYERDWLLNIIWQYGKSHRTCLVSGDTHIGSVAKYCGPGDSKPPIYEICGGNNWLTAHHQWVNGWKGGASGNGGIQQFCRVNIPNMTIVDVSTTTMRISLVETYPGLQSVWTKLYT